MLTFAPCGPPPPDAITPEEAVYELAGVECADPYDPASYGVPGERIEAAESQFFGWLLANQLVAFVPLNQPGEGCCRVPVAYFRSHRRSSYVFESPEASVPKLTLTQQKLDQVIHDRHCAVPPFVDGMGWYVSRRELRSLVNASNREEQLKKQKVGHDELRRWFAQWRTEGHISTNVDIHVVPAAQSAFPDRRVDKLDVRDVVREVDPGRKKGPKA